MTLRGLSIQISLNHKIPVVTLANGTLIGGLSAKLFAYLYKIVMNIIPKCPLISLLFWKCKNLTFFRKKKNIDISDKLVYIVKAPDILYIPAMLIFKPDFLK